MAQSQLKVTPINLRALPAQKSLIDKAASLSHKSRSEFMLEAACFAAENVLLDQRLFFVNEETYQAFVSLLESPVNKNFELKTLLKSSNPWEK